MITRRSMLGFGVCSVAALASSSMPVLSSSGPAITLYGPPAGPSITLAAVAQGGLLAGRAISFEGYLNPDILRASFISGNWQAAIAPSYVAANLANKGLPVKLLNIMSAGLLYVLSFDDRIQSPQDLAGETVGMFYRNDMPDLVFARIMREQRLKVGKDYALHYTGSPIEALQLLLSGRIRHCILPEPAAAVALSKARKLGKKLYRSIDLAREWSSVSGSDQGQPLAGIMLHQDLVDQDPDFVNALHEACLSGSEWVRAHAEEAAEIAARSMPLPAKLIARSIPTTRLVAHRAKDIKPELEAFYSILAETNPAIIGGKLPSDDFYL